MTININIGNPQGPAGPAGVAVAIPANTIVANNTNATANPTGITAPAARTLLSINNVENTSDANKPVSTATQTALDAKAASNHTHGSITNDGKLGSTPNLPLITGADGAIVVGSFGTTANTFCAGDDSRVANAVQSNVSYANPTWITEIAASKITGTLAKPQQHGQTAYYDAAGTWTEPQVFNLAGHEYVKIAGVSRGEGAGNYLTTFGDTDGIPGIASNGYICLNGPSTSEPINTTVAGHGSYMVAVSSDVAADPMFVLQASTGPFFIGYNGGNAVMWRIEADGSARFGDTNSTFWVGQNIASQHGILLSNGKVYDYFGGETHPRFQLHEGGHLTFSLDGTLPASQNGVRFGIESTGTASVWASNGSELVKQISVGSSTTIRNPAIFEHSVTTPVLYFPSGWYLYSPTGDSNWYIRDLTNSRMQVTYTPGASSSAANTQIHSKVTVDGAATFNGTVTSTSTGKLGDFTAGTLPSAASNAGYEANVTDSSVTTFGSTVAGSGSSRVKVYSNGTNWTVQAA